MNEESEGYANTKAAEAESFARKIFEQSPPLVGFVWFPRPLSGVARRIVETMIARAYMAGVNSVLRENIARLKNGTP